MSDPMALAKVEPIQTLTRQAEVAATRALEPNDLDGAYKLAQLLHASRLCPASLRSPEAVLAVIISGRELGLTAMQSVRGLFIIEGRISLSADTLSALVLRSSVCAIFEPVETSDTKCVYVAQRVGREPKRFEWTIEMAKTANLLSRGPWKQYPAAMLRARAATAAARAVFPDVAQGLYTPDELASVGSQSVPEIQIVPDAPGSGPGLVDPPVVDVDVESIIARLGECETLEAVTALSRECKGIPQGPVRDALSAAFKARREALQAEAAA